ncbi:MAG: hypothetical protein ACE5KU_00315 [Nitrososphaerales archaeon]
MDVEEVTKKRFDKARKEVESKFQEVSKEVDLKIKELLEKTYKQFEKTYGANSRRNSDDL